MAVDLGTVPLNGGFYQHNDYGNTSAYVIDADATVTWHVQNILRQDGTVETTKPLEFRTEDFNRFFTMTGS